MNAKTYGTKNNHKYFPEFIIKSFYGKDKVEFLDAKTCTIMSAKNSKIFNVERGWYSDENEKILNRDAEQEFQKLSSKINKATKSGDYKFDQIKITPKTVETIYRFFAYQMIRDISFSKILFNKLIKTGKSDLPDELPTQDFQNELIKAESTQHMVASGLKDSFAIVIEPNFTELDFVATNVPVMINFLDGRVYVLVVAPRVSFTLVSWEIYNKLDLGIIRDDGLGYVVQTNERIMAHAIKYEPHIVLGRDKNYLKSLWQEINLKIKKYKKA